MEFLASVYLCSVELVLFACQSERNFPWSADLYKDIVVPINFYKIFELVVRADTGLTKEAIKHLNKVEESVLDEFAWASESPLWTILEVSRSVDSFGEHSNVPGSQHILTRTSIAYVQRNIDLPQPIIVFFKKVYQLVSIRIADLCERLRILDDLTRHKIWTLFEHVFRMQTYLLRDRHVDQLLMCIVYIVTKVCSLDITFQNIIYHYRHQPQATNSVYRRVVLVDNSESDGGKQSTSSHQQREHVDLITFYNRKFVECVEEFVKLLHPSGPETKENIVPLIPFPKIPLNPLTPRKLIAERINVVPMTQYDRSMATLRYDFHRSPSKDLKRINTLVGGNA